MDITLDVPSAADCAAALSDVARPPASRSSSAHTLFTRPFVSRGSTSRSPSTRPGLLIDAVGQIQQLRNRKTYRDPEVSMTSPGDAGPVKPPPSFAPGVSLVSPKTKLPEKLQSSQHINDNLADSSISSSPTVPFSPAFSDSPSRSASPIARAPSAASQLARSSIASSLAVQLDGSDDVRSLIIRAFSPAVGVYASEDTDELARQKGFKGGFRELIRPFGETVPGKVVIRDSNGSSRGWEDYGIRFVELAPADRSSSGSHARQESPLAQIEEVLEKHLDSTDDPTGGLWRPGALATGNLPPTSPFYKLFLRRLLSTTSLTPHETFGHPVACVIAISSRNTAPLESLRQLYADTSQGSRRLPPWVHPEFLRYYVLVHDEDRDDITESTKLYDQMKRHFGLHCHLLRLRSNQCVVTDDDSVQVPPCEWLSPSEDLSKMGETGEFCGFNRAHLGERKLTGSSNPG